MACDSSPAVMFLTMGNKDKQAYVGAMIVGVQNTLGHSGINTLHSIRQWGYS